MARKRIGRLSVTDESIAIATGKTPPVTDKEFMTNDRLWPGLLLPLKRPTDQDPHTAYLANPAPKTGKVLLRIGNIWFPKDDDPVKIYDNIDALLADGWRVD